MKQYTHAWLAMMAIKRLDMANIPETEGRGKNPQQVAHYAKSLVRWFKNYRDFVVQGAWYPDQVFHDQGSSHGAKYSIGDPLLGPQSFLVLPKTMEIYNLMMKESGLYEEPYVYDSGNVIDRVNAMCHTIVDNFKIQFREEKGNPISPSSTHMSMRFFILSHYIADAHMPMHCDSRKLDKIHASIEEQWETEVKQSYRIDEDNLRFFYDPDGYPLATDGMTNLIKNVEQKILSRPFVYSWGNSKYDARKYVKAVTEYSYLLAHEMVPKGLGNCTWGKYKKSEPYKRFEEYSSKLMADAVDSIARAWLHVWIRYRDWGPDKKADAKKETEYSEFSESEEAM